MYIELGSVGLLYPNDSADQSSLGQFKICDILNCIDCIEYRLFHLINPIEITNKPPLVFAFFSIPAPFSFRPVFFIINMFRREQSINVKCSIEGNFYSKRDTQAATLTLNLGFESHEW